MVRLYASDKRTQFQNIIIILGCAPVEKEMMSLFERQFLALLIVVRQNKQHYWNPEQNWITPACF